MATSVLNSEKAAETSLFVIRTFVRLREMIASHKGLAGQLNKLEKRLEGHDASISEIVKVLRQLMQPDGPLKKNRIIPKVHATDFKVEFGLNYSFPMAA
ncbi:MAG: hypothetical protein RQ867_09075 [Mariprofundaceae bacterium]|nr:hypothetical protein [Mariprofundaceae bacterium]